MLRFSSYLFFILFTLLFFESNISAQLSESYQFKSVQIVGGGFVDGIVFHPTVKGLRYCRTDMGGAYRWDKNEKRWLPLLDWISYEDNNLMGVESIAVDPSDPQSVYLSCGTYTNPNTPNGAILRSNNLGKTFSRTNVPFKMGGNENGRGNGERMAVDPNNGDILYLGTRNDGLWKSTDRAVTWNKVTDFPDIKEELATSITPEQRRNAWWNRGSGIVFVVFDASSGKKGNKSLTIYVGVSLMNRNNIFRSSDGGSSWQPVGGQPQQYRPNHAVLSSAGYLYITYGSSPGPSRMTNGAVWKLDTKTDNWTEITPDKPDATTKPFGYAAVAVDAQKPQTIIASAFGRPGKLGGDDIFRSLDGGATWKPVFATGKIFDYSMAPYPAKTPIHWMFDIETDPFDSNHALFTTGYGGHETFNLTENDKNNPVKWEIMATGIEETVPLELLSPPKGAHLLTAIGDYCGFVHNDLDKPSPDGCNDNPHFGNTNGITCATLNPEVIVRVGIKSNHLPGTNIGYSLNGGKTWNPTTSMPSPDSKLGYIAVSANGKNWIWTPDRCPAYVTNNNGNTWAQVKGLPDNTRVVADHVNPGLFYAIALFEAKLYISEDSGKTFTENVLQLPNGIPKNNKFRGDTRGGQDRIYATPGYTGDLWIAAFDGLYRAKKTNNPFIQMLGVTEIHGFGFGKAKEGKKYPALYLAGIVNGTRGIYRSDDEAKTWVRINDDQHQYGLILHITGDPKKYGRVYIGTHGRGTIYGDPVND